MKGMTLREICLSTDVTRRAVQGYERAGLVSASGKNERGYLLYDEYSQERIKKIRFFQQLGFTVKEIKDVIDAPGDVLKAAIEERLEKLKEEKSQMEYLINKAYELIETL